jgi:4,5-DOPA dioxygenase extradiol
MFADSAGTLTKNSGASEVPVMADRMPAIFFGHGNPMNAIVENEYSKQWTRIGEQLPRPKAVLCVSAHWYLPATAVTSSARPRTIRDFGGFPQALYEVDYPAPGSPELAGRVRDILSPTPVHFDEEWGLDHGTWSVLCHVFARAEVPVVQLSIHAGQPPQYHHEIGRRLTPLRDEGILIIGSGNIVHNLNTYVWDSREVEPFDWAVRFEKRARRLLADGDHAPLVTYETLGPDARLCVPTPEHYLPLLYVLGASTPGEPIKFPVEGVEGGSISMLAVQFG